MYSPYLTSWVLCVLKGCLVGTLRLLWDAQTIATPNTPAMSRLPAAHVLTDILRDLASEKAHHGEKGKVFQNPWPSFTNHGFTDVFSMLKDWCVARLPRLLLCSCFWLLGAQGSLSIKTSCVATS
jgi:hypothetical protein